MKKFLVSILVVVLGITAFSSVRSEAVLATAETIPAGPTSGSGDDKCNRIIFLGLRPWYMGLAEEVPVENGVSGKTSTCVIKTPKKGGGALDDKGDDLAKFVWTIILNISTDIAILTGYVALGFIIFGGYKYITSAGEPGQVAIAKKTITNAVIGLVIALLATVITNTILVIIRGATK